MSLKEHKVQFNPSNFKKNKKNVNELTAAFFIRVLRFDLSVENVHHLVKHHRNKERRKKIQATRTSFVYGLKHADNSY